MRPGDYERAGAKPGQVAHTVYRFFDADDELLWVGVTATRTRRFAQHREQREWWTEIVRAEFEHFGTRAEAEAAEREQIQTLHPRYNVHKSNGVPVGMLSTKELAEQIRVSSETVRVLANRGYLPVAGRTHKGSAFFDWDETEAWIRAGRAALPTRRKVAPVKTGSQAGSRG